MEYSLFIPIIFSFFITFLALPFWIKKAKRMDLMWEDINKSNMPKAAGSGGIAVILGFILGVFFFIAIRTFIFKSFDNAVEIFALMSSVLILAGTGIIDDLLGWGSGGVKGRLRGGLSKKFRLFLCLVAAVPLIVINAGSLNIDGISLGLIYPLLIILIGIIGAATTFNFLAGFNGLEAGQGIILSFSLAIAAFFTGNSWISVILLIMAASLAAFFIFNKFPAKVFPGDVLTYPVGGLIAIAAILGNIEKIAIFFFIPYILELILKLRGKLKKYSFGKPNKDNNLELAYSKIYGLEHLAIFLLKKVKKDGKVYEKDVVYFIFAFQIIIILIGFLLFRNTIF